MKITSFSLNNFAPEEFFGGAKCSKILECDRTMKAFSFVERNKYLTNLVFSVRTVTYGTDREDEVSKRYTLGI